MRASNNSEINLESSTLSPSVHLKKSDSIIDREIRCIAIESKFV